MAWFTESDLEELAGGRSFGRGLGYVEAVTNANGISGRRYASGVCDRR
jgi:hypothetical protein